MKLLENQAYIKIPDWDYPIIVDIISRNEEKQTINVSYYCGLHERRLLDTVPTSWIMKEN